MMRAVGWPRRAPTSGTFQSLTPPRSSGGRLYGRRFAAPPGLGGPEAAVLSPVPPFPSPAVGGGGELTAQMREAQAALDALEALEAEVPAAAPVPSEATNLMVRYLPLEALEALESEVPAAAPAPPEVTNLMMREAQAALDALEALEAEVPAAAPVPPGVTNLLMSDALEALESEVPAAAPAPPEVTNLMMREAQAALDALEALEAEVPAAAPVPSEAANLMVRYLPLEALEALEAPEVPAAMPAPPVVTTLMVRNLPRWLTQRQLLECIESGGFGGVYDFCHVPRDFRTKMSQGHAFVNFLTPEAAAEFYNAWNRTRLDFSHGGRVTTTVTVSAAKVQGLAANLARWSAPSRSRVRNPIFRPFVRGG